MFNENDKKKNRGIDASFVTAVIFLLFLALFPKYSPFLESPQHDGSIVGFLFKLYFFIADQTLGIVHEGGHGVCYIFHCPQFITAANGTIFQIAFPLGIFLYYKKRQNSIGAYIALFFTGFSLSYTAWYISTSDEGLLVPASKSFLGVDGYHDFNYILSQLHLLDSYILIAGIVKFLAFAIMIYSVYKMFMSALANRS